jgi:murein L,D-transpeptidase YcbB/YkuD
VPSTIATRELFPKEKAHPGYFASHDFVVVQTDDGGQRLVQKAGNQSALGKVKFDFANRYGVYLHDTPSHGLFTGFDRLASHGCVRLQRPVDLAKLVMQGDPVWTPEALDAAIATGKTQRVPLPQPISVYLLYWTAYMGTDGMMNFRDDPYGWDADLMTLLKGGKLPDQTSD